jgi:hypothetical protein
MNAKAGIGAGVKEKKWSKLAIQSGSAAARSTELKAKEIN